MSVKALRLLLALTVVALLLAPAALSGSAQSGRRQLPPPVPTPTPGRARTVRQPPRAATVATAPAPETITPTPTPLSTPAPTPAPLQTRPATAVVVSDDSEAPPPRAAATPVSTPTPASDDVDDGEVVRISSNLVPVPASVVDARGRAVVDLELKDFELTVDGTVRPIGDISRAETPVILAVLFDNSSSLRPSREFEKKAGVAFFRRVMRPVDRAAIFSISTEPEMSHALTSDVRSLVRTIEEFPRPEGATALFDTVAEAARYLKPHTGRKVIVVVSDGTDTTSNRGFDETLAAVLAADCQVYAVQTGHSDNPNLRDLAGERRLEEFAANTGGSVYAPQTTSEFESAFTQIAADLAQQYIIGYYPSDQTHDGRFHTLTLRVTTRPALRVRTRKGYYSRRV